MATQDRTTDATTVEPATSPDDDEALDEIAYPTDFLRGKWRAGWPAWTIFPIFITVTVLIGLVIMEAVIILADLGQL
jgi:hypothetical protein